MKQLKCTLDSKYLKLIIVEKINRVDFLIIYIYFSSRIIINALFFNRSACKYFPYPFHFQPVSPPPSNKQPLYFHSLVFNSKDVECPVVIIRKSRRMDKLQKKKNNKKNKGERDYVLSYVHTRRVYHIRRVNLAAFMSIASFMYLHLEM